jgi:hypothetical protein
VTPPTPGIIDEQQAPFATSIFPVKNQWLGEVNGQWEQVYAGQDLAQNGDPAVNVFYLSSPGVFTGSHSEVVLSSTPGSAGVTQVNGTTMNLSVTPTSSAGAAISQSAAAGAPIQIAYDLATNSVLSSGS